MSKNSEQSTSIVGMMVFNMAGPSENAKIWCSECGDEVSNVEYQGDVAKGKLKLGGICKNCSERINFLQDNGLDSDLFQMIGDQ